jgi:hypothetical protein
VGKYPIPHPPHTHIYNILLLKKDACIRVVFRTGGRAPPCEALSSNPRTTNTRKIMWDGYIHMTNFGKYKLSQIEFRIATLNN